MSDFPSNERLNVGDHSVGDPDALTRRESDGGRQAETRVSEMTLPGTPDTQRMQLQHQQRQTGSGGGSGGRPRSEADEPEEMNSEMEEKSIDTDEELVL
jgi:hypothetical protein